MKVHFLPELQRERNDRILKRLRRFAVLLWVVLLACVGTGASLYFRGPVVPVEPQLIATDTGATICDAAIVSVEYAICAGDGPTQADLVAGSSRYAASRVKAATLPSGLILTLYRLASGSDIEPSIPTVTDGSEQLIARSNGVVWQGVGMPADAQTLTPLPELTVPQGVPVYLRSDAAAIIGLTEGTRNGGAIAPITKVLETFPEIAGSSR